MLAALCGDAARKEQGVRATLAAGIEAQLAVLCGGESEMNSTDAAHARDAGPVGVVLARDGSSIFNIFSG
jgi:hypothetical protein